MKEFFAWTIAIVFALVIILLIGFGLNAAAFGSLSFWGPKYADLHRSIYENTAPYVEGMAQNLRREREEYTLASPADKVALRTQITLEYAAMNTDHLPPDLQAFLYQLKGN